MSYAACKEDKMHLKLVVGVVLMFGLIGMSKSGSSSSSSSDISMVTYIRKPMCWRKTFKHFRRCEKCCVGKYCHSCQLNNNGNRWQCKKVFCDPLVAPINGTVATECLECGSRANYKCDSRYQLSGSDTRYCRPDGEWSDNAPSCLAAPVCNTEDRCLDFEWRLTGLEIAKASLEMRVSENEAINNNQSLLIDEQKTQQDELQTTKPAVALKVRYSGSQVLSAGDRIMYDTVVVDVANSFNLATGSFNAPRAGVYMFNVYTCAYPGYWGVLRMFKFNGMKTVIAEVLASSNGQYSDCNSDVTTSYLDVGTEVWVEWYIGSSFPVDINYWNSFTAVLIG